jgi:MIP family channel proteins
MAISINALIAEFVAMWLFVIIGPGTAMSVSSVTGGKLLQVSLAFGFAIAALAYSIGHYSGGHINCAVTLALILARGVDPLQGVLNILVQTLGSIVGAATLCMMFPDEMDQTQTLGSNFVSPGFEAWNALIGEIVMTFLLVTVVLQTAVNPKSQFIRAQACIAIGFAVFLAHCVLIPVDGCSINPTRSIGPAIVSKIRNPDRENDALKDLWIFIAGPLVGSLLAAGVYMLMIRLDQDGKGDA